MNPDVFGKDLRGRLWALWHAATFSENPRIARVQLLNTAILACDLLSADDFKDIAPYAKGWPVVLAGTKERARDWKKKKALITKLRAGENHPSRFTVESAGAFSRFVDLTFSLVLAERDKWNINDPAFGKVTAGDVKQFPELAVKSLSKTFGSKWESHPYLVKVFGDYRCRIGGDDRPWKECLPWQKRQFVRDKFKGAARTYGAQLARFEKRFGKNASGKSDSE